MDIFAAFLYLHSYLDCLRRFLGPRTSVRRPRRDRDSRHPVGTCWPPDASETRPLLPEWRLRVHRAQDRLSV